MPILKNQRHELFAQNVAKGMSATEAYKEAGYTGHRQSAHKLLTKTDVEGRVAELKEAVSTKAAEATALTKEWVIQELRKTYLKATEVNQISAAVGALKLLGAESGMFTERSKTEGDVRWVVGASMSEEDKVADVKQWSGKFADASKSSVNGANGANGHS